MTRPRPLARLLCWLRGHDFGSLRDGPILWVHRECRRCGKRLWLTQEGRP